MRIPWTRGFSLLEVVFAVAIFAGCLLSVVALFIPTGRAVAEVADTAGAASLIEQVRAELERTRDSLAGPPELTRLDRLAAAVGAEGLRLVADRAGQRLGPEGAADGAEGLPPRDRYYLVLVRPQRGALAPVPGSAYLALEMVVQWPYQLPAGASPTAAVAVPVGQARSVVCNFALTP